ncbi:MAG: transcription elongation factor GreA [Clostridia bacterium]|nr:transcription elongation factor GreA [Clostridia bacterium]MBR4459490.1 transcription elongation factor GreA [Clostridia bacterium]
MAEKKKITRAGLEKLQAELDSRVAVTRNEIAREIEFARSYGDLSENAEYTEAKKKQAENETKIAELEDFIKVVEVIEDDEISSDRVSVGTTVGLKTLSETNDDFMATKGETVRYAIVGAQEADPMHDRISDESEVGKALIGAAIGDTVSIPLEGYTLVYAVLSIEKGDQV